VIVRNREVPPARVGVADVDVDRVPPPVNEGTAGRVLEDAEDALGGGTGRVLVVDGGEGVAVLEEGERMQSCETRRGRSLRVVGFARRGRWRSSRTSREDRIVLGLAWWEWGCCWRV
jgi:hypothetical protein